MTNYLLHSSDLAPAIRSLDSALVTAMPLDIEPIRLLVGYTDLLFGQGVPATDEVRRLAVRHIQDLVVLALGRRGTPRKSPRAAG